MGKGARKADGSSYEANCATHGAPLGGDAYVNTIKNLGGDPTNPFVIFPEVAELYAKRAEELKKIVAEKYAKKLHGRKQTRNWLQNWNSSSRAKLRKWTGLLSNRKQVALLVLHLQPYWAHLLHR